MNTQALKISITTSIQSLKSDEAKSNLINEIIKASVAEGMKANIPAWFHYLPDGFTLTPGGVDGFEEVESLHKAFQAGQYEAYTMTKAE